MLNFPGKGNPFKVVGPKFILFPWFLALGLFVTFFLSGRLLNWIDPVVHIVDNLAVLSGLCLWCWWLSFLGDTAQLCLGIWNRSLKCAMKTLVVCLCPKNKIIIHFHGLVLWYPHFVTREWYLQWLSCSTEILNNFWNDLKLSKYYIW